MSKYSPGTEARPPKTTPENVRYRPEQTLLYQLVERDYPLFAAYREAQGRALPSFVQRTLEEYLKCGRLAHGFLPCWSMKYCRMNRCGNGY